MNDNERQLAMCGNHTPGHLATSQAEMQELSKTKGCVNWKMVSWERMVAQCGNHTPAHMARSHSEMQSLSSQKGCTNWQVVG